MTNDKESGGIVVGGGVEPDRNCHIVLPLSTRDQCAKGRCSTILLLLFAKATV